MWARVFEIALGGWLIWSVWLLNAPARDAAAGVFTILLAALSFRRSTGGAHLGILAVAAALVAVAFATSTAELVPAAQQNEIVTALLLATFAIVPSRASEPPDSWQEFNRSPKTNR